MNDWKKAFVSHDPTFYVGDQYEGRYAKASLSLATCEATSNSYAKRPVPVDDVRAASVSLGLMPGRHVPAFASPREQDISGERTLLLA